MNKTAFIYGLNDPETGKCRYVGKTISPRVRVIDHLGRARRGGKTHRDYWISGLVARGLLPQLEIIDEVPILEWEFWEREYIRVFRATGFNLTNLTEGGEGVASGRPFSEAHRAKISKVHKGRKFSPEHRERIGAAHRGRIWSEEQRRNVRLCKQTTSEETRQKMRAAWVGRKIKFGTPKIRFGSDGRFLKLT